MSRHHLKEYRPNEALALIVADRAGQALACPSCGSVEMSRAPSRTPLGTPPPDRVVISCDDCGRQITYTDRVAGYSS